MDRPNLAKLSAEKRAAVSFHVRALKDRLRIEAAYLKLQKEIEASRNGAAPDGQPRANGAGDGKPPG